MDYKSLTFSSQKKENESNSTFYYLDVNFPAQRIYFRIKHKKGRKSALPHDVYIDLYEFRKRVRDKLSCIFLARYEIDEERKHVTFTEGDFYSYSGNAFIKAVQRGEITFYCRVRKGTRSVAVTAKTSIENMKKMEIEVE